MEPVWLGPELPADELTQREHTAGAGGRVTLGVVGRLQRWKRVELALRGHAGAARGGAGGACCVVIGGAGEGLDEDYPAELRAESRGLGVADAVEFTGHLRDGAARMADLDVLVHCAPS